MRGLGPLDATMIVIGSMIGSGIFITSAESTRLVGAPGWLLLAWVMAGAHDDHRRALLRGIGGDAAARRRRNMFSCARPTVRRSVFSSVGHFFSSSKPERSPRSQSPSRNLPASFCPRSRRKTTSSGQFTSSARYAISLSTEQLVAVLLILFLTWINTRGLEIGKLVQNTFTFAKTAALARADRSRASLGWKREQRGAHRPRGGIHGRTAGRPQLAQPGLTHGRRTRARRHFRQGNGRPALRADRLDKRHLHRERNSRSGTNLAARAAHRLRPGRDTLRARESRLRRDPVVRRNRARAAESGRGRGDARGPWRAGRERDGGRDLISTFGCNNGLILAGARVYYAMARDGLFFRAIARTNARHVPAAALLAQGIWAALLTLPRTVRIDTATGAVRYGNVYTQLLEYIVAADLVFYVLLVAAVMVLRRKNPDAPRPYRAWGYPVVPLVAIGLATLLIVDLAILAPATCGIGCAIVLSGFPVFFLWNRRLTSSVDGRQTERHGEESLTACLAFALLLTHRVWMAVLKS